MAQKERFRTELGWGGSYVANKECKTDCTQLGERGHRMSTSLNFTKLPLSSLLCLVVLICTPTRFREMDGAFFFCFLAHFLLYFGKSCQVSDFSSWNKMVKVLLALALSDLNCIPG